MNISTKTAVPADEAQFVNDEKAAVFSKVTRRLVPLLFICYVMANIDRVNIGIAQIQMKSTLGFSDAVYGIGADVFFV